MNISRMLCAAVLSALCATTAFADCAYPKKPKDPPNGSKATQEDMIAAQKLTKQFNTDVETYLTCLETETEALIAGLPADTKPEKIQQIKGKQAKKHNAAIEDMQKYADSFNKQLRAFKAK